MAFNNQPPVRQSMQREDFFRYAAKISSNPLDRVSPKSKAKIETVLSGTNRNQYFVDAHIHAFNHKNIPSGFAMTSFGVPTALMNLIASIFTKRTHKLVKSSPTEIIKSLLDIYYSSLKKKNALTEVFLVQLMMDMQRSITGEIEEDFNRQLNTIIKLRKDFQYSKSDFQFEGKDNLLPFLAVDPHNPEIYSIFISCFSKAINTTTIDGLEGTLPFVGVKIYPSLGYLPYHPTLMDIFEICEKKNIPVITHAGGSRTHLSSGEINLSRRIYDESTGNFEDKWQNRLTDWKTVKPPRTESGNIKDIFLSPETWKKVLYAYPNLKLSIAHLGSSDEWERINTPDRYESPIQTIKLIEKYNNVYCDFSYAFHKVKNLKWLKSQLNENFYLQNKVMYGSDYFLNEVEKGGTGKHLQNVMDEYSNEVYWENIIYKNALRFLFEVNL